MKKNILFYGSFLIAIFFFSCNKSTAPLDSEDIAVLSRNAIQDVWTYSIPSLDQHWDGLIVLSAYDKIDKEKDYIGDSYYTAQCITQSVNRQFSPKGNVVINNNITLQPNTGKLNYQCTPNSINNIKFCYGANCPLTIFSADQSLKIVDTSWYIPKVLKSSINVDKSITNAVIKWNKDEKSTHPVLIVITFDVTSGMNAKYASKNPLQTPIITEDDGEYQFQPENFTGMPQGATIEIGIYRGNYRTVSTKNDGQYLMCAFSNSTTYFELY